jgi:hypothetical protein
MKKIFFLAFVIFTQSDLFASADFFEYYLNTKLSSTTKNHGDYSMGTSFNGSNLGTLDPNTQTLVIDLVGTKTFQNNTDNIGSTRLFYRVYPQGSPSGSFVQVNIPYLSETSSSNPRDKEWQSGTDINLLTGITAVGTYEVEIYFEGSGSWSGGSYTISRNNSNNNYKATFTTTSVLAVSLLSFSAQKSNNSVVLTWETASEKDNAYFDVERSADAKTWQSMGQVASKGNAQLAQKYTFMDENPLRGTTYYRLKDVDMNGKSTYSKILSVDMVGKSKSNTSLYPSVSRGEVYINLESTGGRQVDIQVFDAYGRLQKTLKRDVQEGTNLVRVETNDLASGQYWLTIGTEILRFVKL